MTKSFTTDKSNDLFINLEGLLSTSTGLDAVMQNCETAAKAQLGEMVLAIDQGIPNFQTIWQSAANVVQFEAYLRRTLLAVDGVLEVTNLETVVQSNTLFYTATIKTIYGQGTITNG